MQPATASGKPQTPGPTLEQFEALAFAVETFDHAAHVYVAWRYLQHHDLYESIGRYRSVLRRLTETRGIPGKYNETITWFFLTAVSERLPGSDNNDWTTFREQHPELLADSAAFLRRFYSTARLASDSAKKGIPFT